jgi:hypothetical protein
VGGQLIRGVHYRKHTFVVRENLCRAFYFGCTTKSSFAMRILQGARLRKNARQRVCLPCEKNAHIFSSAHDKVFPPSVPQTNEIPLFVKKTLPCAFSYTHDKPNSLSCVLTVVKSLFSTINFG